MKANGRTDWVQLKVRRDRSQRHRGAMKGFAYLAVKAMPGVGIKFEVPAFLLREEAILWAQGLIKTRWRGHPAWLVFSETDRLYFPGVN
jgi:hypothetical protein